MARTVITGWVRVGNCRCGTIAKYVVHSEEYDGPRPSIESVGFYCQRCAPADVLERINADAAVMGHTPVVTAGVFRLWRLSRIDPATYYYAFLRERMRLRASIGRRVRKALRRVRGY